MAHRTLKIIGIIVAAAGFAAVTATAGAADLKVLTKELFAVPSTTGNEEMLAARIKGLLPKTLAIETEGLGGFAVRLPGAPGPTLILAALDGYGHMVSGITPEGLLTIDRAVAPPHARFDAFLLGQPVVVSTAKGPVRGVVSQPAIHILTAERRRTQVEGFSLDIAHVDIGARSEKDARAKGVELLDPVTFPAVLTELAGGEWAGPSLGVKAAAAALLAAVDRAAGRSGGEETIVAWAAQTKASARGRGPRPAVGAARAKARWQPQRTIIVDIVAAGKEGGPVPGRGPVLMQAQAGLSGLGQAIEAAAAAAGVSLQLAAGPDTPLSLPFGTPPGEVVTLALPVRFIHTPSEAVAAADLERLVAVLEQILGTGGAR